MKLTILLPYLPKTLPRVTRGDDVPRSERRAPPSSGGAVLPDWDRFPAQSGNTGCSPLHCRFSLDASLMFWFVVYTYIYRTYIV